VRAIRITQANWLNDEIGGDANTVKLVRDEMAYEAVEVWHIAEYAPEHDITPHAAPAPQPAPAATEVLTIEPEPAEPDPEPETEPDPEPQFVGPERAAERLEELQQAVAEFAGASGEGDVLPELEKPSRRPYANESKAAWITWAVRGDHDGPAITGEEAAQLTKNELMNAYGERL
jgi:hypothetical protein